MEPESESDLFGFRVWGLVFRIKVFGVKPTLRACIEADRDALVGRCVGRHLEVSEDRTFLPA